MAELLSGFFVCVSRQEELIFNFNYGLFAVFNSPAKEMGIDGYNWPMQWYNIHYFVIIFR